jgi:hypothetical protein
MRKAVLIGLILGLVSLMILKKIAAAAKPDNTQTKSEHKYLYD